MDATEVRRILEERWPGLPGEKRMVVSICELSAPATISAEMLIRIAEGITLTHQASTPEDDDAHYLAQSPFDGKWYTFAVGIYTGGFPDSPSSVDDERPEGFVSHED